MHESWSLVLSHGSRKDKTKYFYFLAKKTNEAQPHEETFFARKFGAQIHEAKQPRKPY